LNLRPFSDNDPNNEADSSNDEGIVQEEDWPIDIKGMALGDIKDMALGPIAEIAKGW
jgi:hypothetical protein